MKLIMTRRIYVVVAAVFIWLAVFNQPASRLVRTARAIEPIVYAVKFPAPDAHYAEVTATTPTEGRATVEMMMAVWTPGFYRVEDYASRIESLSARAPDGKALEVEQPRKNRWLIRTNGATEVIVSYRLLCTGRSVTTNWVGDDLLVLNGAATFVTLVEQIRRPHDVKLELPAKWKRAMPTPDAAPRGLPNHYRAADYDTLVDSPIVAGALAVREFDVEGAKHFVVDAGESSQSNVEREAQDLEKI